MRKRKVLSLFVTAAMIAGMLGGCKSGGDTQSESGNESGDAGYTTTYGDKKFDDVTITVELFDRSNAPEGNTLTDNKWVEYINQEMNKVGITVEFVGVPRADEVTKMQTMMASQTAPDITLTYNYAYAQDYFNQGGTWDLSEFIDGQEQARNMKEYLGEDVIDLGRTAGGNLYGIVARRSSIAASNMFIRKDWLDKLNLDVPTTPDELFHVLDQFVHNNPDGRTDVIGLHPWVLEEATNAVCYRNNLALTFSQLAGDEKEMAISNGIEYYYDPGQREYFRFLNRCYNAGLLDKEYYTMTEDLLKSHVVNGTLGFYEFVVNSSVNVTNNLVQTLQANVPGADLVSIPAMKNVNDQQQYSEAYSPGGLIAFCPKTADAEKVEACMTYLDWLCKEDGGFVISHGFEGENYELNEDGVPIVIDSGYNAKDKDWISGDLFLTGNGGYFKNEADFSVSTAAANPEYAQYVIDNYANALSGTVISADAYTSPSTPELKTDIDLACTEWVVKCVTCSEDEFDANYDQFLKACEDAGIETIVKERTEYYNEIYGE